MQGFRQLLAPKATPRNTMASCHVPELIIKFNLANSLVKEGSVPPALGKGLA